MIAKQSALQIDAKLVEQLAVGQHPLLEQQLVQLAREGNLRGIVVKPPRYSATSIQWHADCERKFFWPTLAGLDSPPSESMKFGTRLHYWQEHWLKFGTPQGNDAAGKLAAIGAMLLPKPMTTGLQVEAPFELKPEVTGLPVIITGTKDFVVRPQEQDAKGFLLGDHKTMRSKRYFHEKTKAWLGSNIQSNVYAYAEWVELFQQGFDQLRVVDKQWVYYFREDRAAEKLRVVDSLDHVQEQFESVIKPRVASMAAMVAAAPRVADVPMNESACDAYGGCPHRARCFGMGAGSKTMGVLAGKFSKGAIAAKAAGAQPPPPQGAGTAVNPPAPRPFAAPKAAPVKDESEFENEQALEQDAAQEEQEEAPPPEPKAAKKGKKTQKPAGATEKVAEVAAQTERAFAPKGQSLATPGLNSEHDYWLFVGCAPSKGFSVEPVLIETIIGAAQGRAAQGTHSGHYREGYGLLEAAFAQWLEENPLQGAVVVDPGSIVARDVISLLRAHATVVVERRA